MDSYSLEEIKMLIDKNMMTSDILKNIFISTTRRIDLYDSLECVEILKFLSLAECVPKETKEEITKYLADYNNSKIVENENIKNIKKERNWRIILLYLVVIVLITIGVILYFK